MLKRSVFCAAFMLYPLHSMEKNSPENEAEVYKRMLFNCLPGIIETYHGNDWIDLNSQADNYWGDPMVILTQRVENQVNALYPLLLNTFLNNEKAAKCVMADYFNAQCEKLYDHFLDNKNSSYSYFRRLPTQYSATLAYESKAVEMGIHLNEYYHQLYDIENQNGTTRIKLIEGINQQLEEQEKENKRIAEEENQMVRAKKMPAPPKLLGQKKPYRSTPKELSPSIELKTTTRVSPLNHPPINLLEEIRNKSTRLKHVAPESFKRRKDPESLEEILKKGLKRIHRGTQGLSSSPSNDTEGGTW